jgi:hypothetical protein
MISWKDLRRPTGDRGDINLFYRRQGKWVIIACSIAVKRLYSWPSSALKNPVRKQGHI